MVEFLEYQGQCSSAFIQVQQKPEDDCKGSQPGWFNGKFRPNRKRVTVSCRVQVLGSDSFWRHAVKKRELIKMVL